MGRGICRVRTFILKSVCLQERAGWKWPFNGDEETRWRHPRHNSAKAGQEALQKAVFGWGESGGLRAQRGMLVFGPL